MYDHMTSPIGREVCVKGWQVSGIHDAIQMTSANLPSIDPFSDSFSDLDLMGEGKETLPVPASYGPVVQKIDQFYVTEHDDSESNDG